MSTMFDLVIALNPVACRTDVSPHVPCHLYYTRYAYRNAEKNATVRHVQNFDILVIVSIFFFPVYTPSLL